MGLKIAYKCNICNSENNFRFVGNINDFNYKYPIPNTDFEIDNFINFNYINELNISKYKFYTDASFKENKADYIVFETLNLKLNKINNYCQMCNN